jgi:hypothetical protein
MAAEPASISSFMAELAKRALMSSVGEVDRATEKKKKNVQIVRRRARVLELYNKGLAQAEMAEVLSVDQSTISRDVRALSVMAEKEVDEFFGKRVHLEYSRLLSGVEGAIKMVWKILDDKDLPSSQRMAALSLLLKYYETRKEWLRIE